MHRGVLALFAQRSGACSDGNARRIHETRKNLRVAQNRMAIDFSQVLVRMVERGSMSSRARFAAVRLFSSDYERCFACPISSGFAKRVLRTMGAVIYIVIFQAFDRRSCRLFASNFCT